MGVARGHSGRRDCSEAEAIILNSGSEKAKAGCTAIPQRRVRGRGNGTRGAKHGSVAGNRDVTSQKRLLVTEAPLTSSRPLSIDWGLRSRTTRFPPISANAAWLCEHSLPNLYRSFGRWIMYVTGATPPWASAGSGVVALDLQQGHTSLVFTSPTSETPCV